MATREEIQAGADIVRFMNIIHDLFDGITKITDDIVQNPDGSNLTIPQKKEAIIATLNNIKNYFDKITNFASNNPTICSNGLATLSITKNEILNDLNNLKNYYLQIKTLVSGISNQSDVTDISNYKKSVIPELKLVRNA